MNNSTVSDDVMGDYLHATEERLDRIASDLLDISSGALVDLDGLKRELHTLKELSGKAGFIDVSNLYHLMENGLSTASAKRLDGSLQALLDGCDFISAHARAVASGATIPKTPESILTRLQETTSEAPQQRQQRVAASRQAADSRRDNSIDDSADEIDRPPARRLRYLIVDDNEANRYLLQDILAEHGDCDAAEDGQQAIDAFGRAMDDGRPYDAVFLDIMMPGIDGHVALESIRSIEHQHGLFGSSCAKVIMTTAAQGEQHVTRAFKTGCQSYVAKPIEELELFSAMRRLGVIETNPKKRVLRFRDDVTEAIVKTTCGSTQVAEVVNESRIDINLLVDDVSHLRPSQEVVVVCKQMPMVATIETIDPQSADGKYPICMMWQ